jgi:dimethylargininase
MPNVAITRAPGPELARCELTHLERQPIDIARALEQHARYQELLRRSGFAVEALASDPALPDGVFVEDTAIVLDELAVMTSPARPSRRAEPPAIEAAVRPYRTVERLPDTVYLEGGDVLRVGRTLYVGLTERTNHAGVQALARVVGEYGYDVVPVAVRGCLHFKTACCALDEQTLLVNRDHLDIGPLRNRRLIDVPADEPWGANVLLVPGKVVVSASHPRTADVVERLGYAVEPIDVSELHKAESGLTCMSLLVPSSGR